MLGHAREAVATIGHAPSNGMHPRRLRIGVDAHAIGERKTGNERFIAGVLGELAGCADHEVVAYVTERSALDRLRDGGTHVRLMRPRSPALRICAVLPHLARRDRLDVLLVQGTLPPRPGCPVVSVVHDVAFARHPEHFHPLQRLWITRSLPAALRNAAGIVTVSEFSKAEIADAFGIAPERVAVAYDGVDARFRAAPGGRAARTRPPYVLAVGNLQPRKNLVTLVRAVTALRRSRPDIRERLVVAGQAAYRAGELARVAAAEGAEDAVELLGYVSDEELVDLLHGATALAYPSVYEGFGLPVVEAMAAGAPVIASDIPVMREIAGDAALLVDPRQPQAWAAAIAAVAGDAALRARLRTRGLQRSARYTWRSCAESVLGALEAAAAV
ncbi:MAG TPA: glycosyltransferase family 1 protein [Candidatus Dormibacteraeota bacterium]|nr:glycosyltransferase family 1 protein [Candidatus Dormibacteraeota bacterium]